MVSHWKQKEIDTSDRKEAQWLSNDPYTSLLLKGLGFTFNTRIYLVPGEGYWNGSTPRQYFTNDFQNMFTHSTLLKEEEPKPFRDHHNMQAGLDFVVAIESDVFAYTYEGNMVKAVQGHWRFEDFKTTISRDRYFSAHSGILLFEVITYVYLAYMVLALAFAPLEYYSHLLDTMVGPSPNCLSFWDYGCMGDGGIGNVIQHTKGRTSGEFKLLSKRVPYHKSG